MPTAPKHDYERDGIEQGFDRIRRVGRILGSIESALLSILLVVFGVLAGAIAGAAVTREWIGIITGAVVGAAAGVWLARRKLVREHLIAADVPEAAPGIDAPHLPGVQEQFARARARIVMLTIPLCVSLGILLIMAKAGRRASPFPAWMHEAQCIATLFGVAAASLVFIAVNSRCPQCRRRLPDVIRIRQCPNCGVSLRD
jgi:hypothetical protein